jgi:hypothetical protein
MNLVVILSLGNDNPWAWRIPAVVMRAFPRVLMSMMERLPGTPCWFFSKDRSVDGKRALELMHGEEIAKKKFAKLDKAQREESNEKIGYMDMLIPGGRQFHPSIITIMGQANQALNGYGAVSVCGPQIFELLGFSMRKAEFLTLGNCIFYFLTMMLAWTTIAILGRRKLMVWGAAGLAVSISSAHYHRRACDEPKVLIICF